MRRISFTCTTIFKRKIHDLDYIEKHEKEEEQEYQNYIQLQIDKENNIPIHQ